MILDGYKVAENLDNYTLEKIKQKPDFYKNKYIAFLLFEDNEASRSYIKMKQKKAEKFGLETKVIEKTNLKDYNKAIEIIHDLNEDQQCIGILVQLPINQYLKPYQGKILASVYPQKDIDGLGGILFGLNQIDAIRFLPATVRAIFEILYFYKIPVSGQNIAILGQSNLVGKPTACECMRQQATVFSFNHFSNPELVKNITKKSDIIISATGQLHLINNSYLSEKKTQVLIDVGWGKINGKVAGDFNFEKINLKNHLYTPVPGGVGPVTVSSIFANLVDLQDIYNNFEKIQ